MKFIKLFIINILATYFLLILWSINIFKITDTIRRISFENEIFDLRKPLIIILFIVTILQVSLSFFLRKYFIDKNSTSLLKTILIFTALIILNFLFNITFYPAPGIACYAKNHVLIHEPFLSPLSLLYPIIQLIPLRVSLPFLYALFLLPILLNSFIIHKVLQSK